MTMSNGFLKTVLAGLGIVTGRVSKLVVLDFDSETIFNDFKAQYPDLLETHTVRSAGRGLPHLYFKLPDHLHLDSQKGQGIDLLSDGRYVVAPPTIINDQPYQSDARRHAQNPHRTRYSPPDRFSEWS